jgi:hypothetical protein
MRMTASDMINFYNNAERFTNIFCWEGLKIIQFGSIFIDALGSTVTDKV